MRNHPKQLLPLIYALESYEDVVNHLRTVCEGLMKDVDNGNDLTLVESDREHLKQARNWQQTAAKYLREFEGSIE